MNYGNLDKDYILNNVFIQLCNADNVDLDQFVYRTFWDLICFYRIWDGYEDGYNFLMTKEMLEIFNVTEEELYRAALQFIDNHFYVDIASDADLNVLAKNDDIINKGTTFIISSHALSFGANSLLLYKEIFHYLGNELIIIPASIHEVYVKPLQEELSLNKQLKHCLNIIKQINEQAIDDDEILSYSVYLYRYGEIECFTMKDFE